MVDELKKIFQFFKCFVVAQSVGSGGACWPNEIRNGGQIDRICERNVESARSWIDSLDCKYKWDLPWSEICAWYQGLRVYIWVFELWRASPKLLICQLAILSLNFVVQWPMWSRQCVRNMLERDEMQCRRLVWFSRHLAVSIPRRNCKEGLNLLACYTRV